MHERISTVPRPSRVDVHDGHFTITPGTRIRCTGADAFAVGDLLAEYLRPPTGYELPVVAYQERGDVGDTDGEGGEILLRQSGSPLPDEAGFVPERHTCRVTSEGVVLEAESAAGLARGVQTLRQLLPPTVFSSTVQQGQWTVACMYIEDAPRFRWRGLHLDVSRHFFTAEEVCRFIELLALHRMNVCHLHLTDDQGWRMPIERYPRLTEIGSRRAATVVGHSRRRPRRYDDTPHAGFYTKDEIRHIVEFASRRHVIVVPEIDMPGHMQAAIAAYPELGNTDATIEPRCHWGISQHVLNMEESTVRFMQGVLEEVIELFPSRFVHVGGDEAPRHEWQESRSAQRRMGELGLTHEDQLQSWFIGRMDEYLAEHGRRLIGWDEILEGGLASGATVMSWRGEKGGLEAAELGHDVVMAPKQWVYFDYYQAEPIAEEPLAIGGMTPTDRVYAYEPVPEAMPPEQHPHILGAQGQLWSEYIADLRKLEYMTYPRACALAEVLWLEPDQKRFSDFHQRLTHHRDRLRVLEVNAHPRP